MPSVKFWALSIEASPPIENPLSSWYSSWPFALKANPVTLLNTLLAFRKSYDVPAISAALETAL